MSRQEKNEAIMNSVNECRANLVKQYATDGEDLFEIARAFLAQTQTILVPLIGAEEASRRLHAVADAIVKKP